MDTLSRIRVVLARPSHPGNIGAAARAMKTMGLADLALVSPRHFPDPDAMAMAAGAADVLAAAHVFDTLEGTLADCALAVGFSARERELSHAPSTLRDAAPSLIDATAEGRVALVFGNETSGLSNEELSRCQRFVVIPSNPAWDRNPRPRCRSRYELWSLRTHAAPAARGAWRRIRRRRRGTLHASRERGGIVGLPRSGETRPLHGAHAQALRARAPRAPGGETVARPSRRAREEEAALVRGSFARRGRRGDLQRQDRHRGGDERARDERRGKSRRLDQQSAQRHAGDQSAHDET